MYIDYNWLFIDYLPYKPFDDSSRRSVTISWKVGKLHFHASMMGALVFLFPYFPFPSGCFSWISILTKFSLFQFPSPKFSDIGTLNIECSIVHFLDMWEFLQFTLSLHSYILPISCHIWRSYWQHATSPPCLLYFVTQQNEILLSFLHRARKAQKKICQKFFPPPPWVYLFLLF